MLHYVVPCIDEYSNVAQRSNSNRYQAERYGQNFTMVGSSRNIWVSDPRTAHHWSTCLREHGSVSVSCHGLTNRDGSRYTQKDLSN